MIQSLCGLLTKKSGRGFTLIELAIVLGVAGLLFAGLWRLMSGGNQALRDQSTANSQSQLIAAVKGYLASTEGKNYMASNNATTTAFNLPLPTSNTSNANCQGSYANANLKPFCNYLPAGFTNANTNPYGQIFRINIVGDGAGVGTIPNTYSFMILTNGGEVIPDSSGGRIASLIGGDGAFVYTNGVCGGAPNPQSWACGAYGAWSSLVTTYGFAATTGGLVASRTYFTPEQDSNLPWLARGLQPADQATPTSPNFNTMRTTMLFAASAPNANSLYFNTNVIPAPAPGLGQITMNGGSIHMANGLIDGVASITMQTGGPLVMSGGSITMVGGNIDLGGGILSNGYITLSANPPVNPLISLATGCSIISTPGCPAAINITTGDIAVPNGEVNANTIYAQTFIYQASDYRLKANIHPLTDASPTVLDLKPVSFDFKSNGKHSFGFIAQDVEKIFPDLVSETQGTKFVNYDGLIAPLVQTVQELKQENAKMQTQLKEQAAHQQKLEQEIRVLKNAP